MRGDVPKATADIVQLDLLRIAAAFAVVLLHVSAGVVLNPDDTPLQWWGGNIGDAASRWCIAVFVMISGALLLAESRPLTPREFYTRRAARLLAPLIFWTVLYLAYRRFNDHTGLGELVRDTLKGAPYSHLWFLYMILGLYAVTPLLKTLIANSDRTTLTITAAATFLIASTDRTIWLTAMSAHHDKDAPHTFLLLWLPYTAYFLAGYILVKWPVHISAAAAITCAVISTVLVSCVVSYAHNHGWQDPYFAYDSFNPLGICMSLPLFAYLSHLPVSCSPTTRRRFQSLAGLTLGIYLVHPLWLSALQRIGLTGVSHHTFVGIPLTAATAFVLSALTTAAIRSTPILRRVV
jgi:surface polysaccharide O-acyltransferase-like enzyme